MVPREPEELPLPQKEDGRIAHVSNEKAIADAHGHGQRCAHAPQARVILGKPDDVVKNEAVIEAYLGRGHHTRRR